MAGMYGCFKSQGSDSAAMASGSPDLKTNQEPGEVREESSGKKKSKFQTFKKFFARKKRKQPSSGGAEVGLKASQSIDNVSKTLENNALTRSEKDKGSGSKITLGGKAMSHDSVFVSDSSEANEALGASQDSIHGKVKSLQLQLKQAIRLGSPPSLMCVKKSEDAATMSEDDGLPCSPPEYAPFHSHQDQRNSSNSLHGLDSDNDQLSCGASSRAVSPLVVPADFSQPASPFACLDNSAAKHKLGLRHKAHDRRKPARFVQRLDGKTEADSAVEENLVISTPGAETNAKEEEEEEEEEERNTEDVSDDQLKPKVERETEEEEERHQLEDPRLSLLRGEEGEDESEAEADVSHGPDTSCEEEQSASEEETSDGPPVPSSESTLPLDPPRVTPEPPAGSREHVTPNTSSTEEDSQAESGSTSGEEAAFQQEEDGESSLLEEVLSSLKTPLKSCSLEGEDAEEETEENQKEVEEKEEDHIEIQSTFPCSFLSDQIAEDPKDSWQEEDNSVEVEEDNSVEVEEDNSVEVEEDNSVEVEEEEESRKEEEESRKEEEESRKEEEESRKEEEESRKEEEESRKEEEEPRKEEEEPVKEEEEPVKGENHLVMENFNNHHEEETKKKEEEEDQNTPTSLNEEEEEEEFINLEKEDEDEKGEAQQQEEEEESEAEKMPEMIPCTHDKEDQRGSLLEEADEVTNAADEKIHLMRDKEDDFNPNSEHVEEDEENEEADFEGEQPEKEEEATVEEVEHESDDLKQSEDNGLPEPLCTKSPQESVISSSSKTSIININLVSPSSEKSFQFSPAAVSPDHSVTESLTAEDEEEADPATKEEAKEDEKSPPEQQDSPPVTPSPEETKVRFTIAPAWQRSQSLSSPSSSPVCISSPREEEVTAKDCTADAEPAGEAVFGPGRVKAAGSPTFKSQSSPSSVKASSPVAANTAAESAATTGGNPDNPFGVRLRKTSALLRFNSEEETLEDPVESVNPSTSCKGESPQVCSKPSICQPVCNKPALPKKPEVHVEAGGKLKRFSDPPRADPPSWISVAKQKQKIYKGNVLDEMTLKKEEQEKKSSLPSKEPRSKAAESSSHAVKPENIKPSVSPEKDPKRVLSPQTPAPSQPFKSQLPPCPVAPKPQVLPPLAKHSQPSPPQKSLPPPTPVPVHSKRPSTPPSKPTSNLQTAPVPSPSFVSITTPEKSPSRSAGPPGQRGLPTPALPQDEPPWMALAKKKAKAWSEMPQIVQ